MMLRSSDGDFSSASAKLSRGEKHRTDELRQVAVKPQPESRKMQIIRRYFSTGIAAVSIGAIAISHVGTAFAQDLVAVSSITGGSSVFVFRNVAKAVKRTIVTIKPTFTKAQRVETATRVRRQYETIAKAAPRRQRAPQVDPVRNPGLKSLPPAQGAIRFAGVGEFYLAKGDIDLSLAAFRDALELDDTNKLARSGYSDALVARGNDLLSKDEPGPAKPMFLEALKFDPANAPAYIGLAQTYSELNETAEAIGNYEKALEADKKLTEIYVPLGILYYQSGNVAKADELLSKAIAATPESPEVQLFLGLVRAGQSRDEEALAGFTKAKTLDPTNVDAFFNSAETLVRLKRLEAAIPDYEKTTSLKRDHFDAWFGLGEIYLSLRNHKKAIESYTAASKLKNNDWEVFAGLAEGYRLDKNFQLSKANFKLAEFFLTQKPSYDKTKIGEFNSKIGLMVGQECDVLQQQNIQCDWPNAIAALKRAADETQDPVDYVNLGWAYFRAGHPLAERKELDKARPFLEDARTALQKAVNAGPPAEDFALQNLASVYIDLGDNKQAIETLSKLLQKKPELNFAHYAIGVAYFKNNDFANAEKWFRSAIDRESNNITYYMALGNALISRKDGKGLRALIDRLKPISPDAAGELERKRQAFRM